MCELPRRIKDQLDLAEPVLKALFALSDLPFGEPLPALFPTDSQPYIFTMSLLLSWRLILKLIGMASRCRCYLTFYLPSLNKKRVHPW
jgi:hypothetical protein